MFCFVCRNWNDVRCQAYLIHHFLLFLVALFIGVGIVFFLFETSKYKTQISNFFWFKFWQLLKSPCRRNFKWPSNHRVTWFAITPLHYTIWERMRKTIAFILVHIWSINAQVQRNHIWKRPRNLTNRISDLTLISQKF